MVSHLEHDRLVFLALGETVADQVETRHLASCGHCRSELETLSQLVTIGAETQGLSDLPEPPAHLWHAISAEVAAAQSLPSVNGTARPTEQTRAAGSPAGQPGAVTPLGWSSDAAAQRRQRRARRWPGWAATVATGIAAAAAGVVGTLAVVDRADRPADQPSVAATASLAAYGTTPASANGQARVFRDGQLHLHVANLPSVDGYYEVWLIDPNTMKMFSVGVLGKGSDALLPLPANVDLSTYSVVDVSAEQFDNNTAHSGQSLLRGQLNA